MDTGVSVNKTPGRAVRRHFNSKFHVTSRHLSKMFNEVQGKEISGTIIKMFKQMNTSGAKTLTEQRSCKSSCPKFGAKYINIC